MKKIFLIICVVFTSAISFCLNSAGSVNINNGGLNKTEISKDRKSQDNYFDTEYMFILLMDGCYHLYRLESYIDNTGMSQQQWVYVDPITYSGTHTICMNPGDFEYLC